MTDRFIARGNRDNAGEDFRELERWDLIKASS